MKNGWNQRGFLMVEVLVACVIITVALLAVGGMYMQSLRAAIEAEQYTVAATLAQDRLEKVKAGQEVTNPQTMPVNGIAYSISSASEPTAQTNLNLLTATITWTARAQARDFVLTTYLAENI